MENKILTIARPARDLEKYSPTNAAQNGLNNRHSLDYTTTVLKNGNQQSYKWGYLFIRGARNYWVRRWFFLYDGCFGSCNVSTRHKGTITMSDRVSVLLCDIKPLADIDRRFCFEVMCAHQ